jgi:hypothetical protein
MFMGDPVRRSSLAPSRQDGPFRERRQVRPDATANAGGGMSMPFKNPLDKQDVPRNGNRINSGSKRADLIGPAAAPNPPA